MKVVGRRRSAERQDLVHAAPLLNLELARSQSMVPPDDDAPDARPPTLADLVALCRHVNEAGARYVVIAGMAVIQAGFARRS